jgi:ATP-dependent helicase IRC3
VLEHFNALDDDSRVKVWGCSATLQRHDGISLGTVFQHVSYFKSTTDLMDAGYLCGLRARLVKTDIDLSGVAVRNNDFVQAQLAAAVNTPWRNDMLVDVYKEHVAPARKTTLVFGVDIDVCPSPSPPAPPPPQRGA